jgi:hypothetical protein
MHADLLVYHHDIWEPNIIRKPDGTRWFFIDWSDASKALTCRVTHLTESEHAPRVREDNHGEEMDIWGVGGYVEELASCVMCYIVNLEAVRQMAHKWMGDIPTTTTIALEEI